jgi:hypothetical protein
MNSKPISVSLFTLLFAMHLSAQNSVHFKEPDKRNIIKINLLSPFVGTLSLQYESILTNSSSFQLGAYYFSGEIFGSQYPARGVCITSEYRFYLNDDAPLGVYIQPYVRISRYWETNTPSSNPSRVYLSHDFYGIAGGLVLGRQWILAKVICFDIYAGPLFTKVFFDNFTHYPGDLPPMLDGYWLRSGFTVGYYFY